MKVTVEDLGPVQKELKIEISPEKVSKELSEAYTLLSKQVTVRGFRKGKTPRSVLERMYADRVNAQVAESLIKESLPEALKEANLSLILAPEIKDFSKISDGKPFTYSAVVDVWPEFELPQYKGIEIEEPEVNVTDEEVEEQFNALVRFYAEVKDVEEDRPVKEGDIVVIDYEGFIDEKPVEELKEENYYLEVGAGNFNEKFESELIGMEKGAEKDIEISYPEDAINELVAGKSVRYHVKVKQIKQRVLPELNEEFISRFGKDVKSVDDLKEKLRKQLLKDKEEGAKAAMRRQLLDKLLEGVEFPVPERLVEEKLKQMVDNVTAHLYERGYDLQKAQISEDRLKEKMREDAERQVKLELILDKIADKEEIYPEDKDMEPYYSQLAGSSLDKEQLEQAIVGHIIPKIRSQKTVEFLLKNAKIKKIDETKESQDNQDDTEGDSKKQDVNNSGAAES